MGGGKHLLGERQVVDIIEDEQPVGVFRQPMFDRGDGARLLWLQQPQRVGQDNNVFKERVARLGPGPRARSHEPVGRARPDPAHTSGASRRCRGGGPRHGERPRAVNNGLRRKGTCQSG